MQCEEFTTALNGIAQAISNSGGSGCCVPGSSGLNGAGPSPQPANGFEDSGTNFPDGFTDREDWVDYRCRYIQYALAGIAADLDRASVVSIVGMTLSSLLAALGFALLTPIPFDDLIVLGLAIISALGTLGLFASAIAAAKDVLTSDALLCALYNADTAQAAADAAAQEVLDQTEPLSEPLETITKNILQSFLNMDVINGMFVFTENAYPAADCSACIVYCYPTYTLQQGTTGDSPPNDGFIATSAIAGIYHQVFVSDLAHITIKISAISGHVPYTPADGDAFRIRSEYGGAWDIYDSDTPPTGMQFDNVQQVLFLGNPANQFTVEFVCPT